MITDFTAADVPDQSGKTFFVTGANTGIGFEAAKVFAGRGGRVLLGCRNPERGREALTRIAAVLPNADQDYQPWKRYDASKLANLLFTYELDRRLRGKDSSTIAVAVHPGGSDTELSRYVTGFTGVMTRALTPLMRPIMNTAEQGAWPTELAATAAGVEGGQYFGPGNRREMSGPARQVESSAASKDPAKAKQLWDLSIEMTGIDPGL